MVITSRDIVNITGKSLRSAQRMLQEIRKIYGKAKRGLVTVYEFCAVYYLNVEDVMKYLIF